MSYEIALNQMECIEKIQTDLMDLSEETLEEIATLIANSKLEEKQIRTNVFLAATLRTHKTKLYAKLLGRISALSENFSKIATHFFFCRLLFNRTDENHESVDDSIKNDKNAINRSFMRCLFDENLISMKEVVRALDLYGNCSPQSVYLFEAFYKELSVELGEKKFDKLKDDVISSVLCTKYTILTEENILDQYVRYGYPVDTIEYALKYDDTELLQKIVQEKGFSFTCPTKVSLFEPAPISGGITYAQFAAYFGSVKCFEFLVLNKASLSDVMSYAIHGGNLEIIRMCEENNQEITKHHAMIAIKSLSNDVFEWIIDEKLTEKEVDDACIDFYETAVKSLNARVINRYLSDGFMINDDMLVKFNRLIGPLCVHLVSNDAETNIDLDSLKADEENQ